MAVEIAEADERELASWLCALGPQYGFGRSLLLSRGSGADRRVTLVLLSGKAQEAVSDADLDARAHGLVNEACSRSSRAVAGAACEFTPAETEVLRWIRLGRTNREIARILYKSEFTIKTHVHRMLEKSGLDNRLQLAGLAAGIFSEVPPRTRA